MDRHLGELLQKQLYDIIPSNLVVIDREYNIVKANQNFIDNFGEYEGKKCYEVYKKKSSPCPHCLVHEVFDRGKTVVSNEEGVDINNKLCYYVVHLAPLKEDNGEINYVVEMSTDVTETTRHQQQYNVLFERVPGFISIIDKNYRIVRANKKLRDTFGEVNGKHCYEVYKKRQKKCRNCPAAKTFKDGNDHVATEIGKSYAGEETNYIVNTTPLSGAGGDASLVIEIATDITEIVQLHKEIRLLNDFFLTLIQNSQAAIVAINNHGKTEIFNPAAKKLFDWKSFKRPVLNQIKSMMPDDFFGESDTRGRIMRMQEITVMDSEENEIPVNIKAVELKSKGDTLGRVAFLQDLSDIKDLEKQKIDAERLAAAGQTVSGLAFTIRNLMMGVEGGMYLVDTGMKKANMQRIMLGWDILRRNFDVIISLVNEFMSYSKGQDQVLVKVSPANIVNSMVEMFSKPAKRNGVIIKTAIPGTIENLYLDPEGIKTCLKYFITNSIDNARNRDNIKNEIILKLSGEGDEVIFEIEDSFGARDIGPGDKFFSVNVGDSAGLGLLAARKIIANHRGSLEYENEAGEMSLIRLIFNRKKLEKLWEENSNR